jgi:hypothetical protein
MEKRFLESLPIFITTARFEFSESGGGRHFAASHIKCGQTLQKLARVSTSKVRLWLNGGTHDNDI